MSAHSPGPWEYDGDSYIVSPKADVAVASLLAIPSPLFTVRGAWDQEQALANARLIAAAPELLEALRLAETAINGFLLVAAMAVIVLILEGI